MKNKNRLVKHTSPFEPSSIINKEDQIIRDILLQDNELTHSIRLDYMLGDKTFPIHYASLYNSLSFFTRLDLPSSQINLPGGVYNSTPLMFTIYNYSHKTTLFLLLNGADPFIKNNSSIDAINLCVRFDDLYGLILLLSFIENKLDVSKYSRYANVKNKWGIYSWLNYHSKELSGIIERKDKKKFTKTDLILYTIVSLFIGLAATSSIFRLFISSFFLFTFIVFIHTPVYLIFNLFYSSYAYIIILLSKSTMFYDYLIIFTHFLLLFTIIFKQNELKQKNSIWEVKHIVTDLVLENNFDHKSFCYTCLNNKEKAKHCRICNICIVNHSHHCPFVNKCISKPTIPFFFGFIFFTIVLFVFGIVRSSSSLPKFEFLMCFFVSLASLVNFIYRKHVPLSEEID